MAVSLKTQKTEDEKQRFYLYNSYSTIIFIASLKYICGKNFFSEKMTVQCECDCVP